jgi:hypothetical protein
MPKRATRSAQIACEDVANEAKTCCGGECGSGTSAPNPRSPIQIGNRRNVNYGASDTDGVRADAGYSTFRENGS